MTQTQKASAEQLANIVINGIQKKKAQQIISMDLSMIPNAVCNYFIICHGLSGTQVEAIADSAIETVREQTGEKPWHSEGYENAEWILIDYVDVVLHVFQKNVRNFYQLEELWADAEMNKFDDEDQL